MSFWRFSGDANAHEKAAFANMDDVFAVTGEKIASDPLSQVLRMELEGQAYYVKRYWGAGKGLRRWMGRPRVKAEWQNLRLFTKWGIPTAPLVGWGLERRLSGLFIRGALITRELVGTTDLARMSEANDPRLRDRGWIEDISHQLAVATRTLHHHHFAHNDLKWRNILVDEQRKVYLIDCPSGSFWRGRLLRRKIIKDLACLDKIGKYQLSRTQRLRFYLDYSQKTRLDAADRTRIREILDYFEGRE
ncbi:lipopolysaccharide kinase InaA family protein [Pseudomonas sp. Marseille-QA0892]